MSSFPLPFYNVCRSFFKLTKASRKLELYTWSEIQQKFVITHLLFTDNSLVFSKASPTECRKLKDIFDGYAAASEQAFNYEKSSVFFSSSTNQSQIEEIRNIFGLNIVSKHKKYLGLPSIVGRKKISFFNKIKLRV